MASSATQERRYRQQEERVPEHIDPIAHTLRECVVNNIDADMLVRQECPRRTQKERLPKKIHCNSSQEFDEILRTLRMIALTALTTTAMRMAQATTRRAYY